MTREEAIKAIYFYREKLYNGIFNQYIEAFDFAINALRAQPAKLDRSRWEGCRYCDYAAPCDTCKHVSHFKHTNPCAKCLDTRGSKGLAPEWEEGIAFCPRCGKPLTKQAWEKLDRRIGNG